MGCCGRKGKRRKNRGALGRLLKRGGAHTDAMNTIIAHSIMNRTGLGPYARIGDMAGVLSGLHAPELTAEEIQNMDDSSSKALLPGVGAYRNTRRRKKLHNLLAGDRAPSTSAVQLSELIGTPVAALGSAAIGAGIGDYIGKSKLRAGSPSRDKQLNKYRALGALTGLSAPLLVAGLVALSTKRRSLDAQSSYENDRYTPVKNMIIPGRGLYNYYKGIGATSHLSGKNDEELEELKRKYQS